MRLTIEVKSCLSTAFRDLHALSTVGQWKPSEAAPVVKVSNRPLLACF